MKAWVAILLIVVIIFGVSSGMQSYATAQQAQAQIETARVAQVNAMGNLVTILTLALVILVALVIAVAVIFWGLRKSSQRAGISVPRVARALPVEREQPQIDVDQLIQLATLKTLISLTSKPNEKLTQQSLLAPTEKESSEDDLFPWLR